MTLLADIDSPADRVAEFAGIEGFLGARGSLMLDVVFLAMIAILPVLAYSVFALARRRQYSAHKRLQLGLAIVLLTAVTAFEIDIRFFTNWEERAAASPYFTPGAWCPVWYSLAIHLAFAVPTLFIWIYVVLGALRRFPSPAAPSDYSRSHRKWGYIAAVFMTMTAMTGWVFYVLAFAL